MAKPKKSKSGKLEKKSSSSNISVKKRRSRSEAPASKAPHPRKDAVSLPKNSERNKNSTESPPSQQPKSWSSKNAAPSPAAVAPDKKIAPTPAANVPPAPDKKTVPSPTVNAAAAAPNKKLPLYLQPKVLLPPLKVKRSKKSVSGYPKPLVNEVTDLSPHPPPIASLFSNSIIKKMSSSVAPFKKSSSTSKLKIGASLAAAMLSLPWPPPEDPRLRLARERQAEREVESIKKRLDMGILHTQSDTSSKDGGSNCCAVGGNKKGGCSCSHKSDKPCCSSGKFYLKKKAQGSPSSTDTRRLSQVINGESRRKPGEPFHPVLIPPFSHVHTAWPGFDHQPVPNWQRKYMIAKPWPYSEKHRSSKNIIQGNGQPKRHMSPGMVLSRPSAYTDMANQNDLYYSGRSLASLEDPSPSRQAMVIHPAKPSKTGGPPQKSVVEVMGLPSIGGGGIPRLERVGSHLR